MRYTLLGRSGLRVSELALGAMTFGGNWASKEDSGRILDAYEEAGGNFVDTAVNYTGGASEKVLGELLAGERRRRFVLATKYSVQTRPGDLTSAGNSRRNLVDSLETSLRKLRTDRIDLYWVHARETFTPVEEVMRALDDQVRLGKVLYVGVSDWPAWEVSQACTLAELRGWTPFIGLQVLYNLIDRTAERELLPMAGVFDLGVTAWSPLSAGKLTGKYLQPADGDRRRLDVTGGADMDERERRIVEEVLAIAGEGGWSPAQVALAWLRGRPGTIVPIIGATRIEQFADNLACLEVELAPDQRRRLDEVSRIEAGFPHDFLRGEGLRRMVYGDGWAEIDDRRSTVRRAVADDQYTSGGA
jgi:aryl-alcohol dehydrogenase-like predicted oxidoreductase